MRKDPRLSSPTIHALAANFDNIFAHPEPFDGSLLTLQAVHRTQKLWNETLDCNETVEPKIIDVAWMIFDNRPHQRVIEYIFRVGLWDVFRVGKIQLDHKLITAMIEQWRPETHTFHLPFGEATMTLQDIQILFGLCVEGDVVVYPDLMHCNFDWARFIQVYTGFTPAPGGLEETSHLKISLRFLHFPVDLNQTGTYNWGTAVLAYLYWYLCRISISGKRVGGFIPLLQFMWAPYRDILHTLPHCCTSGEPMWWMRVPMLCLENIDWHPADRVMRQFKRIQHILEAPKWQPDHAKHDDRSPIDLDFILEHSRWVDMWINWQPRFVEVHDDASLDSYLEWYFLHRRLLLGNPTLKALVWKETPETSGCGVKLLDDIRGIFDQVNQAFHGPVVPNEQYQQPLGMRGGGRGGRGRERGRGRGHIHGVFIHEGVGDVPLLLSPEPDPQAAAYDDPVGQHKPPTPKQLKTNGLPLIVNDFKIAAHNVIEAGFDGVEINSANNYIIDQFLNDQVNDRIDEYGGSIGNRCRLALEIIGAAVEEIAADRVGVKPSLFSEVYGKKDSNQEALSTYLASELTKLGVLYLRVFEPRD
ncbi:12-oxophytodienoate reductase-like protein [Capsicum baccatum]|uniref:12-oxophytodienoate reductase-like protein n=1 Tax=Capsicum baccatum TaxID=33114 RepID=A0A2G2X0C6_CAPBA|nr:12-oxophytodienoate reductase-like protein [Capsicum baccatum]